MPLSLAVLCYSDFVKDGFEVVWLEFNLGRAIELLGFLKQVLQQLVSTVLPWLRLALWTRSGLCSSVISWVSSCVSSSVSAQVEEAL